MSSYNEKCIVATSGAVTFINGVLDRGVSADDLFNYLDNTPKFNGFLDDDDVLLAFMHDEGFDSLIDLIVEEING